MLLGTRFNSFIEGSPVSVMVRGTLERIFDPEKLETVFAENAVLQYTKELTSTQCINIMSDACFRFRPLWVRIIKIIKTRSPSRGKQSTTS